MKTIIKEINMLEIADIEQALSKYFDKAVSIAEVECILTYCIPMDSGEPSGMLLDFVVGDKRCDSVDLFCDKQTYYHILDGKRLCLDEPWLPIEEVFAFDVSVFKSFDTEVDSSD